MRYVKLSAVAGLALALAACPAGDRDTALVTDDTLTQTAPTAEQRVDAPEIPAGAERANLEAVEGSGVAGEVAVAPRNGDTHVTLMLRNAPANESVGARIQSGTCESPGVEIARLDAVTTDQTGQGYSETNVGHQPHLILDGNHIATVYASGADPERDRPLACATLPQHEMAEDPGTEQPATTRP